MTVAGHQSLDALGAFLLAHPGIGLGDRDVVGVGDAAAQRGVAVGVELDRQGLEAHGDLSQVVSVGAR